MAQPAHFPAFENVKNRTNEVNPFKALIKRLAETYGPAGSEEMIRNLIREEIKQYADELRVDALGNLIAKKRGSGTSPRRKVMLAAHMDEIGVIVTHVDQKGFCRFSALGPLHHLALLGQRVVFANGTIGVIGRERKRAKSKEIEFDRLFIDIGTQGESEARVTLGDAASLCGVFVDAGQRLVGKAFDDRIGCAILVETLRHLKKCANDVYFVFTVQEQLGSRGATTATFGIQPDLAFVVDVTDTGDTPEAVTMQVALGKGPAIKIKDQGILVSPAMRDILIGAAGQAKVPYQLEVMLHSSTDAEVMQVSREGNLVGALSVPLRYMHTPSEMVDFVDVQNAVLLLLTLLSKPLSLPNDR
jgi:putative aminopeptidase FrvX